MEGLVRTMIVSASLVRRVKGTRRKIVLGSLSINGESLLAGLLVHFSMHDNYAIATRSQVDQ